MLVYVTGRKSGRHYRQPVSYVREGETLLTPGGGRWKLNLVEGEPTHVRLRGRDVSLCPELVRDPVEVGRFVPIPKQADGHYDRDRLNLAIGHGFCIVRWSAHDAHARQTLTR